MKRLILNMKDEKDCFISVGTTSASNGAGILSGGDCGVGDCGVGDVGSSLLSARNCL